MSHRITIVVDDDNFKKARLLQAKRIPESTKSVSFSSIINEVLKKGFKK